MSLQLFTTAATVLNNSTLAPYETEFDSSFNVTNHPPDRLPNEIRSPEITIKFVLLLIAAVFLSFITMLGNILVMISLVIDRQLRTISNYFLTSLSVADFMIGFISMPLYTLYLLLDRWPFGPVICDTWLALDYLISNASVLNLLVISVDRYFSVTRPLTYRAKRTTKKALCWIASTWIISLFLWPPWIFYWPYFEGKRTVPSGECYIQFLQSNPYITFFTAIAAFYIPVLTMIYLNFRIWRETQKRYKDITTLFLVSAAGGKLMKNGNARKQEDSQISTPLAASVRANQPSTATLSRNNTSTSCDKNKETNGKINNRQPSSKRKTKRERNFWQRFCTFNESLQSQSTTSNEIAQKSNIEFASDTGVKSVKRSTSLNANLKIESLYKTTQESELETQQLRAHVLDDEGKQQDNELRNQIEIKETPSDSVYTILIQLQQNDSDTGTSIKMIEQSDCNELPNEFRQADTNNNQQNDECKPLTIPSALLAGDSNVDSEVAAVSNTRTKVTDGSSTIGNSTTAGSHYVPQQPKSERKAAKTLSAILLAFIITWTPYNVLALLRSIISDNAADVQIPKILWLSCYYLCYINSTVNPVCYALCNAAFRRTYVRILKCKWTKSKRTLASQRNQEYENRRLHESKNNKYRHWMT